MNKLSGIKIGALLLSMFAFLIYGCSGGDSQETAKTEKKTETTEKKKKFDEDEDDASFKTETKAAIYDEWREHKGVGPVKSVTLGEEIDQTLVSKGKLIYEEKCIACHKIDKRFVGPAPKGIFERRTPEWVMNMMIDPEKMVKEDPIAIQLFIDFNRSPMTNQDISEEDARAILEYFRTI